MRQHDQQGVLEFQRDDDREDHVEDGLEHLLVIRLHRVGEDQQTDHLRKPPCGDGHDGDDHERQDQDDCVLEGLVGRATRQRREERVPRTQQPRA
jgi:hypothetical protein